MQGQVYGMWTVKKRETDRERETESLCVCVCGVLLKQTQALALLSETQGQLSACNED